MGSYSSPLLMTILMLLFVAKLLNSETCSGKWEIITDYEYLPQGLTTIHDSHTSDDCCSRAYHYSQAFWVFYPNGTCITANQPPLSGRSNPKIISGLSKWTPNFDHTGVYTFHDWGNAESTPIRFKDKIYVMESVEGLPKESPPDLSPGSFFRIRELESGIILVNVSQSVGHAFFSARVDYARDIVWVWGAAHHRGSDNKGRCDIAPRKGCYVGAWSSKNMLVWSKTSQSLILPDGTYTQNNAVAIVRGKKYSSILPPHQAVMALEFEHDHEEKKYCFAINTGTDGDFSQNWELLNSSFCSPDHACPAFYYDAEQGWYYITGGGETIVGPHRSNDLINWDTSPLHPLTKPAVNIIASYDNKVAPYYKNLWRNAPQKAHDYLKNMTKWNWGHSDGDYCCDDGLSPTYILYIVSMQGKPSNWTGKGTEYEAMGVYNRTLYQWLRSFFP